MKKQTITIGIPAFNEEANIKNLLSDLLKQKETTFVINKIIVLSDGSTDKTVVTAHSIKNKKISVVADNKRIGKGRRINLFFKSINSDIALIFDADTRINDVFYIHKLINPIIKNEAHLTSSDIKQVKPVSFVEKIIYASMEFKKELYTDLNNGNNIYTCYGYARAFSKKLYKHMVVPDSVGEDAYSYLFAKYHKYGFQSVNNATISYRLPTTFSDHEKQSIRFFHSQKRFVAEFGKNFVTQEYTISKKRALIALIKWGICDPHFLLYLAIVAYLKVKAKFAFPTKSTWAISKTSKKGVV